MDWNSQTLRKSKVEIQSDQVVIVTPEGSRHTHGIGTPEAFRILSKLWLRSGWDLKHVYSFTWLGRPIIQLPEDMFRLQEVMYTVRPDVLIETGVAHGGSSVFYAGLFRAMGRGRVISVEIELRPPNRKAIEAHELYPLITLIDGDSTAEKTVAEVKRQIKRGERVMVCLDGNHTRDHVLKELKAYAPLVTPGSYIVAMDGIREELVGAPRAGPDWSWNHPKEAALRFAEAHPEFSIEEPAFQFNEGEVTERVTYWPSAFIKRLT